METPLPALGLTTQPLIFVKHDDPLKIMACIAVGEYDRVLEM